MVVCGECEEQLKKTRNGKPHENLIPMDELRVFVGRPPGGYQEQDYRCRECGAKFTYSTDRNDRSWTLWRG